MKQRKHSLSDDKEFEKYMYENHPKSFYVAQKDLSKAWDEFVMNLAEITKADKVVKFLSKHLNNKLSKRFDSKK